MRCITRLAWSHPDESHLSQLLSFIPTTSSNAIEITPTFVFFKDLSLSSDTKHIYYTSNSSSMKTGSSEMGKLAN